MTDLTNRLDNLRAVTARGESPVAVLRAIEALVERLTALESRTAAPEPSAPSFADLVERAGPVPTTGLASAEPAPAAGESDGPQGTYGCPICGVKTPHRHGPEWKLAGGSEITMGANPRDKATANTPDDARRIVSKHNAELAALRAPASSGEVATSVLGCHSCGKPAALVGDNARARLCPWCLAERSPSVFAMFAKESITPPESAQAPAAIDAERLVTLFAEEEQRLLRETGPAEASGRVIEIEAMRRALAAVVKPAGGGE